MERQRPGGRSLAATLAAVLAAVALLMAISRPAAARLGHWPGSLVSYAASVVVYTVVYRALAKDRGGT